MVEITRTVCDHCKRNGQALHLETDGGEARRHNVLTALIRRRDGAAGDEVLGERKRVGH